MAYWSECPICGEKNFYEADRNQHFDCGFVGDDASDSRVERCQAGDLDLELTEEEASEAEAAVAQMMSDANALSLYRLAFLDAAHVIEAIGAEIAGGPSSASPSSAVDRCTALANQMRAFAGHDDTQDAGFSELTEGGGRQGSGAVDWVKRMKRW